MEMPIGDCRRAVLRRPLIAIDPSLHNLGYACLDVAGHLEDAGLLEQTTSSDVDYRRRAYEMANAVTQLVTTRHNASPALALDIIIETPENWFGERGMQSKDSEAVQKLYFLVGAIIGRLSSTTEVASIYGVSPTLWKGQTPKHVMVDRAFHWAASQGVNLLIGVPHDTCEAILLAKKALVRSEASWESEHNETFEHPFTCIYRAGYPSRGQFNQQGFVDESSSSSSSSPA